MGPDILIRAHNLIPSPSGYKPFNPLTSDRGTAGSSAIRASFASGGLTKFDNDVYAWNGTTIYRGDGTFTAKGTSTMPAESDYQSGGFAQFNDLILFTGNNVPLRYTIGAASNFVTLAASGTAPPGACIGVIGEFVLIGNIYNAATANRDPAGLQWSAIGDPTNWPTPNSSTAIATQSGYQEMEMQYGRITGIHGGDQFGVILQDTAVTRVTYVGPPVVFQFDRISNIEGSLVPNSSVQAGGWIYFISASGFCRTNGVTVERIGAGKVDEYFRSNRASHGIGYSAYDYVNKNALFAYSTTAASLTANSLLIFNEDTSTWTSADTSVVNLITPSGGASNNPNTRIALGFASSTLGAFSGTAGSAVIETSDAEFNPGGRTYIDGFKPNVESSGTAPVITTRIGYRNSLSTTPSYSAATTANADTGFANFRVDAKYHRAELTITGNFTKVTGGVVSAEPSGKR